LNLTIVATAEWHWVRNDLAVHRAESVDGKSKWRTKMEKRLLDIALASVRPDELEVDRFEMGTPLSVYRFMGARRGNVYGLSHTVARFASPVAETAKIPHLEKGDAARERVKEERYFNRSGVSVWRTGQDLVTAGVGGALASAEVTFWSMRLFEWNRSATSKWRSFFLRFPKFFPQQQQVRPQRRQFLRLLPVSLRFPLLFLTSCVVYSLFST
jgi:hypothetical protein